jgi:hypothetical protein
MLESLLRPSRPQDRDGNLDALSDFESSPLRFEYDIHLEEYKALRDQILMLTKGRLQITNYSIAATSAIAVIIGLFSENEYAEMNQFMPIVLLVSSLVLIFFTLMVLYLDARVAYSGNYIVNVLRPKMERILTRAGHHSTIWAWERINALESSRTPRVFIEGWMAVAIYAITLVPASFFIGIYVFNRDFRTSVPLMENLLFGLTIVGVVSVIVNSFYTFSLYRMHLFSK